MNRKEDLFFVLLLLSVVLLSGCVEEKVEKKKMLDPEPQEKNTELTDDEKIACEEAGGTYAGCPANPSPNMGLCLPCECTEGFVWSFTERTCVGICPGEYCKLEKTIPY